MTALQGRALVLEPDAGANEVGVGTDQEPEIVELILGVEDFLEQPGPQQEHKFGCIDLVGLGTFVQEMIPVGIADNNAINKVAELEIQPLGRGGLFEGEDDGAPESFEIRSHQRDIRRMFAHHGILVPATKVADAHRSLRPVKGNTMVENRRFRDLAICCPGCYLAHVHQGLLSVVRAQNRTVRRKVHSRSPHRK